MTINARFDAGELDQRVELQKPARTPNNQGGYTTTWPVQATVWAQVKPISGNERGQADRVSAEGRYQVVIRNLGEALNLDESWRIRWVNEDREMNIRFDRNAGQRGIYLTLECESGVGT